MLRARLERLRRWWRGEPLQWRQERLEHRGEPPVIDAEPLPYEPGPLPYEAEPSPYDAERFPYEAEPSPYDAERFPYEAEPSPYDAERFPFDGALWDDDGEAPRYYAPPSASHGEPPRVVDGWSGARRPNYLPEHLGGAPRGRSAARAGDGPDGAIGWYGPIVRPWSPWWWDFRNGVWNGYLRRIPYATKLRYALMKRRARRMR